MRRTPAPPPQWPLLALVRESLKTVVIVIYLGFAIWLLLSTGKPYGFAPLLPWALWSRSELRWPR